MFTIFYIKDFGWKTIIKLLVVAIIAAGVAATFISRLSGGDIEAIDRVVFFQGFLKAILRLGMAGIFDWFANTYSNARECVYKVAVLPITI
ncbi:hypothetical protein [Pseudoalteromonas maricaloris]